MQASAIVRYLRDKGEGKSGGKKIVYLLSRLGLRQGGNHCLEAEARLGKFELVEIPVAHPGNEQEPSGSGYARRSPIT